MLAKPSGLVSEPVLKRFIKSSDGCTSASINDFVQRGQVSELPVWIYYMEIKPYPVHISPSLFFQHWTVHGGNHVTPNIWNFSLWDRKKRWQSLSSNELRKHLFWCQSDHATYGFKSFQHCPTACEIKIVVINQERKPSSDTCVPYNLLCALPFLPCHIFRFLF